MELKEVNKVHFLVSKPWLSNLMEIGRQMPTGHTMEKVLELMVKHCVHSGLLFSAHDIPQGAKAGPQSQENEHYRGQLKKKCVRCMRISRALSVVLMQYLLLSDKVAVWKPMLGGTHVEHVRNLEGETRKASDSDQFPHSLVQTKDSYAQLNGYFFLNGT